MGLIHLRVLGVLATQTMESPIVAGCWDYLEDSDRLLLFHSRFLLLVLQLDMVLTNLHVPGALATQTMVFPVAVGKRIFGAVGR